MTTMTRISKRDENAKMLGTSQNGLSADAGPSPLAIPTSQVNSHNGGDLKFSLLIVNTKDLVDSSSERAHIGGDPSTEHGLKQSLARSGDQHPFLPVANLGVAYEPSSADGFGSSSPLFSPLCSPINLPQLSVTVKPQASSTGPTLLTPSRARGEVEVRVTEASAPRLPQSPIHDDSSSTAAVAGPTAKRSRLASVQDLFPVCALDIDFLSENPRAASAPFDFSSPQTQHASFAHEVEQNPSINSSSASGARQTRKPTESTVGKNSGPTELSGNALDPSSADPGYSADRTFNGRSKQTLEEVGIPITPAPLLESSAPTTIAVTDRFLAEMSEEEKRDLERIIETAIQTTGLLTAPKELIARSRMQKRKRDKTMEAPTSIIGADALQPASLTDIQAASAPKPKRKRTIKPKKERSIVANPYPRTTTAPPDPFNAQKVQGIHTDTPSVTMPLVNPVSMAPMDVSRSNGGFDPATSLAVHGDTFSVSSQVAPTHASPFQYTQSTAPGSSPYSFNPPRNLGINHLQGIIPGAVHTTRPAYNPASTNLQRLFWQRAQIAQQMHAGRQARFIDQRYHAPVIPNAMSIPVASEGSWNPQAPGLPSQPSMDAGLPYFFDAVQSVSGQPRTQSNMYPQYQVPNFDHNIQSSPYHMQHPLFNQAPAGSSHSLQPDVFNPPAFNARLAQPTGYEPPFPPIHFSTERQREGDYMTRPAVPGVRAPMQNYPHGFNPSFVNHTAAINLHDDLTTRGQTPIATSSRMHFTLPGSFIGDELTNATQ